MSITYDQILQLKDYDIEYNIKLILLALILIYAVCMVYFSNRINDKTLIGGLIKYSIKIYGWLWIFFSPLFFTLFLFREVSPLDLINFIWVSYGALFLIILVIMVSKVFSSYILAPFGWEPLNPRLKKRYKENG